MANIVFFLGLTRTEHSQAAQLSLMTPREAGVPPGQSKENMCQDRENGDSVVKDVLPTVLTQLRADLHLGHPGPLAVLHVGEDQNKDQGVMENLKL